LIVEYSGKDASISTIYLCSSDYNLE